MPGCVPWWNQCEDWDDVVVEVEERKCGGRKTLELEMANE